MSKKRLEVVVKAHHKHQELHPDCGCMTDVGQLRATFERVGCDIKKIKAMDDKVFVTFEDYHSYQRGLQQSSTSPLLTVQPSDISMHDLFASQMMIHTRCLRMMKEIQKLQADVAYLLNNTITNEYEEYEDDYWSDDDEYDDEYNQYDEVNEDEEYKQEDEQSQNFGYTEE